ERDRAAGPTLNTPIRITHALTHSIPTVLRTSRRPYCKRRDSTPTARSRLGELLARDPQPHARADPPQLPVKTLQRSQI
ncbi:MAG: hypothetical protein ACLP0J_11495, partial [Solirubrobacteraceae bacterium]